MTVSDERLEYLASLPDIDGGASEEIQMARELLALRAEVREWQEIAKRFYDNALTGRVETMNMYDALIEKYSATHGKA